MADEKALEDQGILHGKSPLWGDDLPTFGIGETAETARQIGRVVAAYAMLEFQIYEFLACISDDPPAVSFTKFFAIKNISKREEYFKEWSRFLPIVYQTAVKRVWRRLRGAASRRTDVAHSTYMMSAGKLVRLRLSESGPEFVAMDNDFFVRTIRQYRTLHTDLSVLLALFEFHFPFRCKIALSKIPYPQGRQRSDLPAFQGLQPQPIVDEISASIVRLGFPAPRNDDNEGIAVPRFSWGQGGGMALTPWTDP